MKKKAERKVKVQKVNPRRRPAASRTLRDGNNEIAPPFVTNQNLGEKATTSETPLQSHNKPKEPVRARLIFGKIFQNLAYACLFLGIMALLGVIVMAVIEYWPQGESTTVTGGNQTVTISPGGNWSWLFMDTGAFSGFLRVLQVLVIVAAILIVFWGWRAAVNAMRRLVVRVTDQFLWSLPLVEPLFLLTVWTLVILGSWWLADPELFIPIAIISGGFLVLGLACFGAMRWLADARLDLTRADLDLHKF